MPSITAENRTNPRNQIDCLIKLESLGTAEQAATLALAQAQAGTRDSTLQSGIVQDASDSGARIWTDQPYARDERLLISFGCDKVGLSEERTCAATVVWTDSEPVEGRWQIGIRFHEDDASHAIAQALVQGCPWCEKLCPDIAAPAAD